MKKKLAIIGLIEMIVVGTVFFITWKTTKDSTIEINEFYSEETGEVQHYVDSTMDEELRRVLSEPFLLDKGFYQVDFYYQSNMPKDAQYGADLGLQTEKSEFSFNPLEQYIYLSDEGHKSFEIYVPYNDSSVKLRVRLEDDKWLTFIDDQTRYVLADHIALSKKTIKNAIYSASRIMVILLFADCVTLLIIRHRKKDAENVINS